MKNYNLINMKTINHFLTEAETEEISQKTKEMYLNVFSNWIDAIYTNGLEKLDILYEIETEEEFNEINKKLRVKCLIDARLYKPLYCMWKSIFLLYVLDVFQFKIEITEDRRLFIDLTLENIYFYREVIMENKEKLMADMKEVLDDILNYIECVPEEFQEKAEELLRFKNNYQTNQFLEYQVIKHNEDIEEKIREGYK